MEQQTHTYESVLLSSSASPASSAKRVCAARRWAALSHRVLWGYMTRMSGTPGLLKLSDNIHSLVEQALGREQISMGKRHEGTTHAAVMPTTTVIAPGIDIVDRGVIRGSVGVPAGHANLDVVQPGATSARRGRWTRDWRFLVFYHVPPPCGYPNDQFPIHTS